MDLHRAFRSRKTLPLGLALKNHSSVGALMRLLQDRPYLKSPLLLAAGILFCLSVLTLPATVGAQVVQGHLYDSETRGPIINGTVALRNDLGTIVGRAATDEAGAYELTARAPGTYSLLAVGLGYRSTPTGQFEVVEGEVTTIDISLSPEPLELDPLSVEGRRQRMVAKLTYHGFYERQQQGFGSFLAPEQIKRWPAINVVDILEHAPFVHCERGATGTRVIIRKYGDCEPALYVDGRKLPPGFDIEYAVDPENVVAVEVFRGTTQIPLQWAAYETCGVILIWTGMGGVG